MLHNESQIPLLSRSMLRKAECWEEFPLVALTAQRGMRECLAELEAKAVKSARDKGAPWTDIADALGVSRQAVQQRYGH
jgi:hypothetical protein